MKQLTLVAALCLAGSLSTVAAYADDDHHKRSGNVTLIHIGDLHGHLIPRENVRSDRIGNKKEGGLARVYSVIKDIREDNRNSLLINTGDTIQGSAEVMYTRGQAIVDVLNNFGIDAYTPGNWEFVYGTQRFLELFSGPAPLAPWNTLAANLYYKTLAEDPTTPFPDKAGQRVLPPYIIKQVGNVKVGIIGFTTDRGLPAMPVAVTKGFKFTKGDAEVAEFLPILRDVEKVDLVVMISELGLAGNVRIAEANPGIDVILSSDMHEESHQAVVASTGTVIVEEGQDGTMVGRLKIKVRDGRMVDWKWKAINVTEDVKADKRVARQVAEIRKTFVAGPHFTQHVNPFNGSLLKRPIDEVVGYTAKALHRSNFSHEDMPAVIEGSSHDFITDAFRAMTGADASALRGYRYGTHVPPGPIKMEDLFHYIPIGPQVATGTIRGQAIKNQIENSTAGALDSNVANWTGGWLFNWSGVTFDVDPFRPRGSKASDILVNGAPLVLTNNYRFASYWYAGEPTIINGVPATNVVVLKDTDGSPLDAAEVVVNYLQSLPNQTADTQTGRIRLLSPLPPMRFGFPEMQPLRGVAP